MEVRIFMAKLTIDALKTAAAAYVDATKQLSTKYTPTVDDFTKTVCKIGLMKTLYLPHVNKLSELKGEDLPFGQTIEEFMVNDFLPSNFVYEDGAAKKNATRITFADAVYSYPLAEQLFEVGVPRSQFQRVALGERSFSDLVSSTLLTLDSSTQAYEYAACRQLLGNMATAAAKIAKCTSTIAQPTDSATGEAFVKLVKGCIETASDINDCNLAGQAAAAAPALTLYIKQGIMPSIEVDTMAGAFHDEKLALPANTKVIYDFGNADASIYAILVDPRGVKLHDDKNFVDTDHDGRMAQDNFYRHLQQTGFISKYAYVHVFKSK